MDISVTFYLRERWKAVASMIGSRWMIKLSPGEIIVTGRRTRSGGCFGISRESRDGPPDGINDG